MADHVPQLEPKMLERVAALRGLPAVEAAFEVLNLEFSPIKGPEGNIEYLGFLRKSDEPDAIPELSDVVAASHDELKD